MNPSVDPRVSLTEVATKAGVALSTASNALNDRGRVSATTRARVRAVALELGYQANPVARGLRVGRSRLIGVALREYTNVPDLYPADAYYGLLITASTSTASQRGYALALLPDAQLDLASELPLEAIIVADTSVDDPLLDHAYTLGIPVITDYRPDDPRATVMVDSDVQGGVVLINNHLADAGAKRIALLSVVSRTTHFINRWEQAHARWCEQRGVELIVGHGSSEDPEQLYDAAVQLLQTGCDAVVSIPLGSGPALLAGAAALGKRVPDDLLLAIVDEDPGLARTDPPLTTLGLDPVGTAVQGTHLVIDVIEEKVTPPVELLIPAVLMVRESTQPNQKSQP